MQSSLLQALPMRRYKILQNSNFIFSPVMVPHILVLLASLRSGTKSVLLLEESQEPASLEGQTEKTKFLGGNGEKDLKREENLETRVKRSVEKYQPKATTLELTKYTLI